MTKPKKPYSRRPARRPEPHSPAAFTRRHPLPWSVRHASESIPTRFGANYCDLIDGKGDVIGTFRGPPDPRHCIDDGSDIAFAMCMIVNRVRRCRVCGCTDDDCRQCIKKTGAPCHWVEADLCSACVEVPKGKKARKS